MIWGCYSSVLVYHAHLVPWFWSLLCQLCGCSLSLVSWLYPLLYPPSAIPQASKRSYNWNPSVYATPCWMHAMNGTGIRFFLVLVEFRLLIVLLGTGCKQLCYALSSYRKQRIITIDTVLVLVCNRITLPEKIVLNYSVLFCPLRDYVKWVTVKAEFESNHESGVEKSLKICTGYTQFFWSISWNLLWAFSISWHVPFNINTVPAVLQSVIGVNNYILSKWIYQRFAGNPR